MASHVMHDYTKADLDPQTRGMLDYVVKLAKNPSSIEQGDVENLRSLGLTDEQILSVVLITAYFNVMNRVANGLGVEMPPGHQEAHEKWMSKEAARQEWLMGKKVPSGA
jgi:uncharacterized peroxidase-related enzyme